MKILHNAHLARFIHKHFKHKTSDTCQLLLEAVDKHKGDIPYMLADHIRDWIRCTDNMFDRYVLATELEHDMRLRQRGRILAGIASDWNYDDKRECAVEAYPSPSSAGSILGSAGNITKSLLDGEY